MKNIGLRTTPVRSRPTIVVIVVYFGELPDWFAVFVASCHYNQNIDWVVFSDRIDAEVKQRNVRMVPLSSALLVERAAGRLCMDISDRRMDRMSYKVNDLKPAFGVLFSEYVDGYDFFGYGDLDVIYGDVRRSIEYILATHDVVSTHDWCVSGHFALFRNTESLRNAFRRVPGWKAAMESPASERFDEDGFFKAFRSRRTLAGRMLNGVGVLNASESRERMHMKEFFTTPLTPRPWRDGRCDHPMVWYWFNGHIYNDRDGARDFIYLHFMNYKSARFMSPLYGRQAPWASLKRIMNVADDQIENGVRLDFDGIHPLDDEDRERLAAIQSVALR